MTTSSCSYSTVDLKQIGLLKDEEQRLKLLEHLLDADVLSIKFGDKEALFVKEENPKWTVTKDDLIKALFVKEENSKDDLLK